MSAPLQSSKTSAYLASNVVTSSFNEDRTSVVCFPLINKAPNICFPYSIRIVISPLKITQGIRKYPSVQLFSSQIALRGKYFW